MSERALDEVDPLEALIEAYILHDAKPESRERVVELQRAMKAAGVAPRDSNRFLDSVSEIRRRHARRIIEEAIHSAHSELVQ